MRSYFRFDKKFLSRRNLAGMIKTAIYLAVNHAPVNQITLASGITESEDPTADTRLYISNDALAKAYDQFMTGEVLDPQPEALEEGQEGLQEGGEEEHVGQRAGERAPAGRGHGGAGRAAAEDPAVLLPGVPDQRLALRQRGAAHLLAARRVRASSSAPTGS